MKNSKLRDALIETAHEEYFDINKKSETTLWEPSEKFCAEMEALLEKTTGKRKSGVSVRKVLLIAAVIFLVSVVSVFSSAHVRENVIHFFKDFSATHFNLEYGKNEAGDIINGNGIKEKYTPSALPGRFVCINTINDEHSVINVWEGQTGESLILSQGDGMTKRGIDNERLEMKTEVADGIEYEIYLGNNYILVLWNTAEYTFSIDYYGEMTETEIMNIALSLVEEKE